MEYAFLLFAIVIILFILGWPRYFDIDRYEMFSEKIEEEVKLLILSDNHCYIKGKQIDKLCEYIEKEKPDYILIPGDFLDRGDRNHHSIELANRISSYPTFYSLGNHEHYMKKNLNHYLPKVLDTGVILLKNEQIKLDKNIQLIGLDDLDYINMKPKEIIDYVNGIRNKNSFTIVMSHKPHFSSIYEEMDVDLVVSGHAHGGQWRIPIMDYALFAPNQGIFPKYTRGAYPLKKTTLYVSRGLAPVAYFIPRLFNNPAMDMITIKSNKN